MPDVNRAMRVLTESDFAASEARDVLARGGVLLQLDDARIHLQTP